MKIKFITGFLLLIILLNLSSDEFKKNKIIKMPAQTNKYSFDSGSEINTMDSSIELFFEESEYSYNHKLALESLIMAVSAFSANVNTSNWGENASVKRDENIINYLSGKGFEKIKTYNYDITLNDESSKVAFAIGIREYNNSTNIVAIAVRGGNYGMEWVDNFNIGSNEDLYHIGFKNAADKLKSEVDKYIFANNNKKNIKLWISGYSRGGAVANILASMYNAYKHKHLYQIYAYTFAAPKTVILKKEKAHSTIHRNIFNILSPNDPLYNIPPEKWDFGRFGICVLLPDNNDLSYEDAEFIKEKVDKAYFLYTGKKLFISETGIDSMVRIIIKTSESRDFFDDNLSESIKDIIKIKMKKYKNDNNIWVKYRTEDAVKEIHGARGLEAFKSLKDNAFFNSLYQLGINIPEEFYLFIVLCHLNGYYEYESILYNDVNIDEFTGISSGWDSSSFFNAHGHEFYKAWLENVNVKHLKFSKE